MTFDMELLQQILDEQKRTNDLLQRMLEEQKPVQRELKTVQPTTQRRKAK